MRCPTFLHLASYDWSTSLGDLSFNCNVDDKTNHRKPAVKNVGRARQTQYSEDWASGPVLTALSLPSFASKSYNWPPMIGSICYAALHYFSLVCHTWLQHSSFWLASVARWKRTGGFEQQDSPANTILSILRWLFLFLFFFDAVPRGGASWNEGFVALKHMRRN